LTTRRTLAIAHVADATMKKNQGPTAVGAPSGLPPAEPITALIVVGRGELLHLSPAKMAFTVGSDTPPVTDICVVSKDGAPERISRRHAALFRDAYRLVVHDLSRNGTYFRGRRITKEVIQAGDTFDLVDVSLLAVDEQLVNLREDLRMALGFEAHATVDAALANIAKGGNLLLVGPPGCDQAQLARRIHERSARRLNQFRDLGTESFTSTALVAALTEATLGTVFLDLHRPGRPVSVAAARELFHADRHVRVIVSAPSVREAYERLGEHGARMDAIEIPGIGQRRDDVVRLFDFLCAEVPSERRLGELEPEWDLDSLKGYGWPENLDEMRRELPWLVALAEHKKVRATARALDMPHNTLSFWIKRIGLTPRTGRKRGA
jgi:hypothetical protein